MQTRKADVADGHISLGIILLVYRYSIRKPGRYIYQPSIATSSSIPLVRTGIRLLISPVKLTLISSRKTMSTVVAQLPVNDKFSITGAIGCKDLYKFRRDYSSPRNQPLLEMKLLSRLLA